MMTFAVAAFASLLAIAPASGSYCGIRTQANVSKLADLPPDIAINLRKILPDIVDTEKEFNKIDVTRPGLGYYRLIGAQKIKDFWLVSYEHGGWYHVHTIGYFPKDGPNSGFLVERTANFVGDPCVASRAIVAGLRASAGNHF